MATIRGPRNENPRGVIDRFTIGGYRDKGRPQPLLDRTQVRFQSKSPFQVIGHPGPPNKSFGRLGASFSGLAPTARFDNVSNHAIVLEDTPVGADSRLVFESFPGMWQESYQLRNYRQMGGHRMSQPQFATYQGGDWGPFPLTLIFRAGIGDGAPASDPLVIGARDIESVLLAMEQKVNWLIALGFPLERQNVEGQRILASATATGNSTAISNAQQTAAKLRRNDPPFVLLILGTWKIIRGYLKNISWVWKPPFHPISGRPYGAEVRMVFQPIQPAYPTWQSIRNQAGTAGLSGPITERLPAADVQRIVVTNRLIQNAGARQLVTGGSSSFAALPTEGLF